MGYQEGIQPEMIIAGRLKQTAANQRLDYRLRVVDIPDPAQRFFIEDGWLGCESSHVGEAISEMLIQ